MSGSTVALVLVPGRERDLLSLPLGTPEMPEGLQGLSQAQLPLRAVDMVGLPALRALLQPPDDAPLLAESPPLPPEVQNLAALADALAEQESVHPRGGGDGVG
jgi:hypothetical protein